MLRSILATSSADHAATAIQDQEMRDTHSPTRLVAQGAVISRRRHSLAERPASRGLGA